MKALRVLDSAIAFLIVCDLTILVAMMCAGRMG